MKHVEYNVYQNTNKVIFTETLFHKHNRAQFLFLLQKRDFSAAWEVPWGLTNSGVDGAEFALPSSSSNKMGFSTDPSIEKLSIVVRERGISMLSLNTATMSIFEFSQLNSMSLRSDTW